MILLSPMRVSEIVIIESLEDHEFKTGGELARYLSALDAAQSARISVRLITCDYAAECVQQIRALSRAAANGLTRPILHFECHGSEADGLQFANGSELAWTQLADELRSLNAATGMNLMVFLSACHGAHFISEMDTTRPVPCLVLVGPPEEIDPGDVQASFRAFYRTLFESGDAGSNQRALRAAVPAVDWNITHAEQWFEQVIRGYIIENCSRNATRERALALYKRAQRDGLQTSMGEFKKMIALGNRNSLTRQAFDRFFMLDIFPENRQRFLPARTRLEATLGQLRSTGRYAL